MKASVGPVYVSPSQELLVPIDAQQTSNWMQQAAAGARAVLPRSSALFPEANALDNVTYSEVWPASSGAATNLQTMMVPDMYVRVGGQPQQQPQQQLPMTGDDRVYVQYGSQLYAVPPAATGPRMYHYPAAPVPSSSLRTVPGAAYSIAAFAQSVGHQWRAAPVLAQHGQLRGNVLQPAAVVRTPGTYAAFQAEANTWVSPPDTLLTMYKSNPTGVKLNLEDIIGHVVSFCKDQDGSKLLQKLLKPLIVQDTTSVSLQLVIAEMEPYVLKLMKHIYGRFVFIAFLGTWGSKYRSLVVEWMHGHFDELAMDRYGYAVVKEALKNCDATLRLQIAAELHPNIAQIAEDVFGHDVVCVLTESIPTSDLEDTVNVLVETLNFQNQYSCSVAMALLDAMAFSDPRRACIITKMRLNAHVLAKSSRGILMLERLLDIGTAQEATDVAVMLIPNLVVEELTEHSCAVLLKSLERGGAIARSLFVAVVLQGGQLNIVRHLMMQEYGKEVLQEVLQVLTGLERDALTAHVEKVSQLF